MTLESKEQQIEQIQYRYEYCNIHNNYVETAKQWFYKNCYHFICDNCYQNRKKHECILILVRHSDALE